MNRESVLLRIPSEASYISLVRLTASSVAHKCGMNIDEIEDIKMAIGEACINSLSLTDKEEISIEFIIDEDELHIKVLDAKEEIPEDLEETRDRKLGILIMRSLMDRVIFSDTGVEMTKYIE